MARIFTHLQKDYLFPAWRLSEKVKIQIKVAWKYFKRFKDIESRGMMEESTWQESMEEDHQGSQGR
jgi:hypothetical protein